MRDLDLLYARVAQMYSMMLAQAGEDGVFVGSPAKIHRDTKISMDYYGVIMRSLETMGCIEWQQKGGPHGPSRIKMLKAPTRDAFYLAYRPAYDLTKPQRVDKLETDIEVLQRRLPNINLHDFIASTDQRLTAIENALAQGRSDFGSKP